MNRRLQTTKYVISDYLSASVVWTLFYVFRKVSIEKSIYGIDIPIEFGTRFYLGLIIIPVFWLLFYYTTGHYKHIYRKSRLKEIGQTFFITLIGVIIIFFSLLLDDSILSYKSYYLSFSTLFLLHFTITYIPRFLITTNTIKKIRQRKLGFSTILIGSNGKALNLYKEFESQPKSTGNIFVGFISVIDKPDETLKKTINYLGNLDKLHEVIDKYEVEEVFIAIESSEHEEINKIINKLLLKNVRIKAIPSMYDILTGRVRISTFFSTPLIEVSRDLMPTWQESVKRMIDIAGAVFCLLIGFPLFLFLTIGVKLSSQGSIFYSHTRIGLFGKPFKIYKFRSMYVGAEKNGPALSSKNDSRITSFGRFMRKYRLDEIPQFYNVLIGEMSLVGPRPERQYYIDEIVKTAPHYYHLQKVRPGITSWGQVKFGYAENVEEMIERLKYDLIYIENMSLYVDFKILIYTIKIVLQGSGK